MPHRCSECAAEISSLNYSADAREYGTWDINEQNHECDETEGAEGGFIYCCPECNSESSNPEDIYEEYDEDEEDEGEGEEVVRPTFTDAGNRNVKMGADVLSRTNIQIFPECGCIAEEQAEKCLTHQN